MKTRTRWMAALLMVAALSVASTGLSAGKKNATTNPAANAYGQSFAEWLRDYWAWNFGGVGPQVQPNNVFFLPVPVPAADAWETTDGRLIGTAEMSLSVKPGMKIVLGVLAWIGETYDPALSGGKTEDDPALFTFADFSPPLGQAIIELDGVTLVDDSNLANFYYDPIRFKAPLMYPGPTSTGSIGAVWVQGIGIVLQPLTPGEHTLVLYSWSYWQGVNGPNGTGWHNTWHITVAPPGKN